MPVDEIGYREWNASLTDERERRQQFDTAGRR